MVRMYLALGPESFCSVDWGRLKISSLGPALAWFTTKRVELGWWYSMPRGWKSVSLWGKPRRSIGVGMFDDLR